MSDKSPIRRLLDNLKKTPEEELEETILRDRIWWHWLQEPLSILDCIYCVALNIAPSERQPHEQEQVWDYYLTRKANVNPNQSPY